MPVDMASHGFRMDLLFANGRVAWVAWVAGRRAPVLSIWFTASAAFGQVLGSCDSAPFHVTQPARSARTWR